MHWKMNCILWEICQFLWHRFFLIVHLRLLLLSDGRLNYQNYIIYVHREWKNWMRGANATRWSGMMQKAFVVDIAYHIMLIDMLTILIIQFNFGFVWFGLVWFGSIHYSVSIFCMHYHHLAVYLPIACWFLCQWNGSNVKWLKKREWDEKKWYILINWIWLLFVIKLIFFSIVIHT